MALSFSVPDSVLSTTLANYRPQIEDNVFKSMPLAYWLMGKYPAQPNSQSESRGQKKVLDGGQYIVVPLMYGKNTTARSYSGYGVLDTTPQEGITSAQFNWKQASVSVSISGLEERQNSGEEKIIDLLKTKIMQAEMSLQDEYSRQWSGTGGDGSQDTNGLQNIVSATTTTGGLSGTSYSWWRSTVNSAVGSFATNGLTKMRSTYNSISKGNDHPDLIISDQTSFEYYESVLQPQERFTDTNTADAGFENLKFKGAVMMFDNNTYFPAGYMYFLNSKYLNWNVHRDADFKTEDFIRPADQDARVAQIITMGELTVSNRSRLGVMTGITA